MKRCNALLIFCILIFVLLCLTHYFSRRPLWLDERFILDNIKNAKPLQLLGPLGNSQAFPRLYLVFISIFAHKFNYDLLALRFFPLISMLAAFFVWLKIYYKTFDDKWSSVLTLFSIACSYYFSYYAAELKQYSIDVLMVGIFCLYLIYQKKLTDKEPSRAFVLATLFLPFTLLFSHGAFFVFWIVSYNFLLIPKKGHGTLVLSAVYAMLCFICAAFVYYFDIRHTLSTPALFSYWNDYFISTASFHDFMRSLGEGIRKMTALWFGKGKVFIRLGSVMIPFFISSLFIQGVKNLKNNKLRIWDVDSVGLIIFIELFILGLLKKYPFSGGRITLFYAPFVLYFIVRGMSYIRFNKTLYYGAGIYYIVFLLSCAVNSIAYYLSQYRQS